MRFPSSVASAASLVLNTGLFTETCTGGPLTVPPASKKTWLLPVTLIGAQECELVGSHIEPDEPLPPQDNRNSGDLAGS